METYHGRFRFEWRPGSPVMTIFLRNPADNADFPAACLQVRIPMHASLPMDANQRQFEAFIESWMEY